MTATFTDRLGREWPIYVNLGSIQRVRRETNVAIADPFADGKSAAFLDDPFQFGSVLYVLCGAADRKIGPEEFADGFDGPTMEAATGAMLIALTDFFRPGQRGAAVKKHLPNLLAKNAAASAQKIDEALNKLATN
ncbi:MAG: hypothetical protein ACRDD1_18125 [Planctomycetia bacterium]